MNITSNLDPAAGKSPHSQTKRIGLFGFWALAIILTIAFLTTATVAGTNTAWRDGLQICFFVGLVSLACLSGAYIGLGGRIAVRVLFVLAAPLLGLVACIAVGMQELFEFEVFTCGIAATVALTTLALRRWKGNLQELAPGVRSEDGLRFGIKDIFIWTTCVAVAITLLRSISNFDQHNPNPGGLHILGLACCISVTAVFCIWALLGRRITAEKILILATVVGLSTLTIHRFFEFDGGFTFSVIAAISQALMISFGLLVRMQRFRFVKRPN